MGAGDNSTVKITIDVVDANSGKVIGTTTKNLDALGAAGKRAGDDVAAGMSKAAEGVRNVGVPAIKWMKDVGDAGAGAGEKISKSMHESGEQTLRAIDKVRLLKRDLGVNLPEAIEVYLSKSKAAMAVISSLSTVAIGAYGVQALVTAGKEAYEFYQHLNNVNEEMKKYAVNAANVAQQSLFSTGSIATMNSLVQQTSGRVQQYTNARQAAGVAENGKGSLLQYPRYPLQAAAQGLAQGVNRVIDTVTPEQLRSYVSLGVPEPGAPAIYGKREEQASVAAREQNDIAKDRLRTLQQTNELQALQTAGASRAAALEGSAARAEKQRTDEAAARLKYQQAQNNEEYLYQKSLEARELAKRQGMKDKDPNMPVIYERDPGAGQVEYEQEMRQVREQAAAENTAARRAQMEDTEKIEAAARMASLKGEATYIAQRNEQIRVLREMGQDRVLDADQVARRIRAVQEQFAAEAKKRLDNEHDDNARIHAEALASGKTGLARIDADTNTRLAGIAKDADNFSDPATRAKREADARAQGQQQQEREAKQFSDRLREMDEGRADSSMGATERIQAETRRAVIEIQRAWQELYGGLDAMDARRVQGQAVLQAEIVKINAEGARQIAENRRGLVEETLHAEAEAGRRGLTREQEARQAILDEYSERYRRLEELRVHDAANADLYRRQEIAAEQSKNGKLVEQQREVRDRLAGVIRGYMNNPLDALKRQGEEQMSKYAAEQLLRLTGRGGVTGTNDRVGMFGMTLPGFGRGRDREGGHQGTVAASSSVSAASTTLTAATATINIQTATFATMGGSAGATMPASYAGGGGGGFSAGDAGAFGALPGAGASGIPGAAGGWSPQNSTGSSVMGGLQQGMSMTQDLAHLGKQMFGKSDDAGDAGAAQPGGKSMFGMSNSTLGKVGGAAGGAMGLFSAFQGNGGFGGALSGAMSGAQIGAQFGGPWGAAIGAVAGGIVGFMGFGGKSKARQYDEQQVRPRIANDLGQFGMGGMDYSSAYDDLVKLDKEAREATKQFGQGGKSVWDGSIHPEIMAAQQQLDREQKAGRSKYGMTAAQFDGGGLVRGFGDFATGPRNGWANLEIGETVMHTSATQMHGDALSMMLAGADRQQMAAYYGSQNMMMPAAGGGDVNLHFHSHDARGTYQLFMDNKHSIREALNSSYAENSGGADA